MPNRFNWNKIRADKEDLLLAEGSRSRQEKRYAFYAKDTIERRQILVDVIKKRYERNLQKLRNKKMKMRLLAIKIKRRHNASLIKK